MNPKLIAGDAVEPERYEFRAAPLHSFEPGRREFLQAFGSGILILIALPEAVPAQETAGVRLSREEKLPERISAWLHIGEGGDITVFTGKVEMGQNVRTSLSQAVAEELRVPLGAIHMVMGDTARTPFDMGTFGSRTTPVMGTQLRRAASAACDMLIDLAARRWGVDRSRLVAENGRIRDPASAGHAISYSELLKGQELAQTIPAEDPLTPADRWTISGTAAPKQDGRDFVTGRHRYTSDLQLPGMLYGKVVRPAAFGAALVSVETQPAKALPGVEVVVDGNFIGVAAPSETLAAQAAQAIRAEWKTTPQPSDRELFEYLKAHASEAESEHAAGSIAEGLAAAEHRLEQTYTLAYIAHAPLEPRAALAEWSNGQLTVSTGTQRPFAVRSELAQALRIPEDRVRILVPDTGSAYGGKHTGECAIEAARLARAAGRPVKVVWTREEEFTWAYFRPAGVIEVRSGVRRDGALTAWEFHNYNSGTSGIRTPYEVPHQRIEFHAVHSPLRQGSYRGLAAPANHFARESHMDELAHAVGVDPLEFHMRNLKDARLKAVFTAAAEAFGWAKRKASEGHGFGIAGGVEKGSYTATCAQIEWDRASGEVNVARLVTAFECGAIVNPDGLRNQVEGSMMMGLGGALFEAIDFADGRVLNPRFSQYRVPRFSDLPALDVVLLNRKDLPPAGAGETPIVAIAPAVGNAIFDAAHIRLRSLPMVPKGLHA